MAHKSLLKFIKYFIRMHKIILKLILYFINYLSLHLVNLICFCYTNICKITWNLKYLLYSFSSTRKNEQEMILFNLIIAVFQLCHFLGRDLRPQTMNVNTTDYIGSKKAFLDFDFSQFFFLIDC